MKRIVSMSLALVMGLMILTACGGNNHIGKTYKTYWFNFKVNSAKVIDSYDGLTVSDGFKLVDVEISTTNTSGSTIRMFDWDYYIIWGEGDYDYEYCYDPIDDYMAPSEYDLADKETMTYHYIFQIPEDVTNPCICFWELFENGEDGEYGDAYFAYFEI